MSDETVGRALRGAPSLSPLKVSEKTALIRDVDGLSIVTEVDVTNATEFAHYMRGERQKLHGTQRHRLHVAEIPNVIFHELLRRFGHWKHNQAAWKRWLNDPDNAAFRAWTGRV